MSRGNKKPAIFATHNDPQKGTSVAEHSRVRDVVSAQYAQVLR